jgi:hypothetical protein
MRLVWDEGQEVRAGETDFLAPTVFEQAGGVDCPVATHPSSAVVYRYCCQMRRGPRDFSHLRAFDTANGESRVIFKLGLNQWVVWLCRLLDRGRTLMALVATDARRQELRIVHQLGFFDLKKRRSLLVPLPRDAFMPLAVSEKRQQVLFFGAEGYQLVTFAGARQRRAMGRDLPHGRGAAFHPSEPLVVMGGGALTLWEIERGKFEELPVRGQYPCWEPDGSGLWYSTSSADLCRYDCRSGEAGWVVRVAGYQSPEVNYSRPLAMSADGQYLAVILSRKVRLAGADGRDDGPASRPFRLSRSLVVLDLREREIWQHSCRAENVSWVNGTANRLNRG